MGRFHRLINSARAVASYKLLRQRVLSHPPQSVAIEVTNRCCFACQFCPQSDPRHFQKTPACDLTPERASVLLGRIRDGGFIGRSMHWVLGGEPFLNEQFPEIIVRAIQCGFANQLISTNGLVVSPERMHRFPVSNYTLYVDFCAEEATFERVRGTPGSWRRIRDNLLGIIADPALAHVALRLTDISHWAEPDPARREGNHRDLSALFGGRIPVDRREFHNMAGYLDGRARRAGGRRHYVCPYPWFEFIVASNGDVVACCRDLQHKTVLGNLFEQDLAAIWNGRQARQMRALLVRKQPQGIAACAGCDMHRDSGKFGWRNIIKSALRRYQVLRIFRQPR
ncbi:MAG: SPASM domain-containing protein [Phycisphaerae bacterium]|nr:SPASM domain-containing protein [Phycisphaerae bacterium]